MKALNWQLLGLVLLLGILLTKQWFYARHKWPKRVKAAETLPIYIGKPVYQMPLQSSIVVAHVPENYYYTIDRCISGFYPNEKYFYVHIYPQQQTFGSLEGHFWGYMLAE